MRCGAAARKQQDPSTEQHMRAALEGCTLLASAVLWHFLLAGQRLALYTVRHAAGLHQSHAPR